MKTYECCVEILHRECREVAKSYGFGERVYVSIYMIYDNR